MVDDIDFQTFPEKFFDDKYMQQTDEQVQQELKHLRKVKEYMSGQIFKFIKLYKEEKVKLPKALNLLERIRKDSKQQKRDLETLEYEVILQQRELFNI